MDKTTTTEQEANLGRELEVFSGSLRVGPTPSITEISAMIKGGKPGDMDKLDV